MQTVELRRRIPRWALPHRVKARYKGASGGRSSGKSHLFAEEAVEAMVCDPALRFVCIREVQRSLKFSAKSLVESKIRELKVEHLFDIQANEIRHKRGTGVMIFEGMQDHTADSIKSLEGFGRAWVEEAQSISQHSLDLLLPTLRAEGSEIWFSWNPNAPTDAVDKFFASSVGEPGFVRTHCTYLDNPFCPSVSRTDAERTRRNSEDDYQHIWLGGYFLGGNGRVYSSFLNRPFPEGNIDDSVHDHGGEILVGQDFNVNPMASVIAQRVGDECHILDALEIATSNTEEVAREMQLRYPGRYVIFCPDPAGNQRHTNAPVGQTDFTILRSFGFEVRAPNAHPPVVDRVNNVQKMLHDDGRRRLRIHPRAQSLIVSLGNQVYKEDTSQPDKKGGYDHTNDALGYLCWEEFNILHDNLVSVHSAAL